MESHTGRIRAATTVSWSPTQRGRERLGRVKRPRRFEMRDGFLVVDADRHVMEPSDLWDRYLPEAFKGRVQITGPTQGGRYVDGRQVSDAFRLRGGSETPED